MAAILARYSSRPLALLAGSASVLCLGVRHELSSGGAAEGSPEAGAAGSGVPFVSVATLAPLLSKRAGGGTGCNV